MDLRKPGTPMTAESQQSPGSCYQTPQWMVARLRDDVFAGVICLDPCTNKSNPVGARHIYTPTEDGLRMPWGPALQNTDLPKPAGAWTIFVNPPFIGIPQWTAKALSEYRKNPGSQIIFLVPAAIGTSWFHRFWDNHADDALFLATRIRFEGICATKIGEKPERRTCMLGPDDSVHDKANPAYHRYTEGSPTRGTVLFSLGCSLERLADLGTRALPTHNSQPTLLVADQSNAA